MYSGQFPVEKSRRLTRRPRGRMHANIPIFCHFSDWKWLGFIHGRFPFRSVSHKVLSVFRVYIYVLYIFSPSVLPTTKSPTPRVQPTSINQTTYSNRRFVYINNIFYLGLLVSYKHINRQRNLFHYFTFICFPFSMTGTKTTNTTEIYDLKIPCIRVTIKSVLMVQTKIEEKMLTRMYSVQKIFH